MQTRSITLSLIALFLYLFTNKVLQIQPTLDVQTNDRTAFASVSKLAESPTFSGGMAEISNNFMEYFHDLVIPQQNTIERDVTAKDTNRMAGEPVILDMEVLGWGDLVPYQQDAVL